MAQLGRFEKEVQNTTGDAVSGASVTVYREGATVNGNQSGTTPLTVTVRHPGKIVAADTVFINTTTGTSYTVNSVTATTVVLSGFVGTLALTAGDRIVPSNNQPTLYGDDFGGATTANPLTTSSTGLANCWMNEGSYDYIISGSGVTTTLISASYVSGENPAGRYSGELDSATAVANIEDSYYSLTTAGAKLKSWRNLGTEKASIDKDGTGTFPRIGPVSSATAGGAIRIVDGNVFPITVAGVQAALNECKAIGGGTVMVPANAGIAMATTSVKIPNKVTLLGQGSIGGTNFTFVGGASTNVSAIIENETQDGTQQAAAIQNVSIDGGKASGAVVTAGLKFVSIYSGTYVRGVRIINCSGIGAQFSGATIQSGPYFVQDLTVGGSGGDNILVQHTFTGLRMCDIDSEDPGAGKACLRLQSDPSSAGRVIFGALLENIYIENASLDATSYGIVLDGTQNCSIINFGSTTIGAANFGALLRIQKTGTTAPIGNIVKNLWTSGIQTPLIDDNYSTVTVTNAISSSVSFYETPVIVGTDSSTHVIGVQNQRMGLDIASTAALTLSRPANFFTITGTADVTSIATSSQDKGRIITLMFSGTKATNGVVDGSNLKLASTFAYTPDDTLTLISDGTNWYELARSVN